MNDCPKNTEAEKALVGSILLRQSVLDDVTTIVQGSDFHDPAFREMFETLADMHGRGKKVDPMLLSNRLRASGKLESVGGAAAIAEAFQSVPNHAHARYYADIVREAAIRRRLMDVGAEVIQRGRDESMPVDDALAAAEQLVLGVGESRANGDRLANANEAMLRFLDRFEARRKGDIPTGLPTGIYRLDAMTGGMRPCQLIVIGGRPSQGKSALAQTIAEHVALVERKRVLYVSLEMSEDDLSSRLNASVGRVDLRRITAATTDDDETAKVTEASRKIADSPLTIDENPNRTVAQIAAFARRLRRRDGLALLIVDYVQLVEPDNKKDLREQQIARITRRLKLVAKELQIPVVLLAQINRQAADTNEAPRLHHLRESGALENDADVVLLLYRPDFKHGQPQPDGPERAQIIVGKQRNGPVGPVDVIFMGKHVRFENAASKWQKEPERVAIFDSWNGAYGTE